MQRLLPLFFLLLTVSLFLLGCGGGGVSETRAETAVPTPAADTSTPESEVLDLEIKGFLFRPVTVTMKAGTTVRWTNLDDIQHFVTNGRPTHVEDHFDSGPFVQNEQFAYTFTEPGEYHYFCQRHPHMQATIIVEE